MNTFGELFRVTTFGESHGPGLGAVIDGCPAGVSLTTADVQRALDRRRPGQSKVTTARAEGDVVELLSGVYEDQTLGTPIAALVRNVDQRSADYAKLAKEDRPGHADRVWRERFKHRDPRGGGRTSGRETLSRVIGGAVAEALLKREVPVLSTVGWVSQVGPLVLPSMEAPVSRAQVDATSTRCPDAALAAQMEALILDAKGTGDSLGGVVTVRVDGLPVGLGEPVFGKLKALLAHAVGSIGAVSGIVWGPEDLEARLRLPGTQFHAARADGRPSDVYGGIQGGLSNGEPLVLRALFKPPATLTDHAKAGRHDPCILPRAVPVVEAMVSMVLADLWLHLLARPHHAG
ncbi:MAG: chorismate synthase [Archangium sp.]|nr:chorismate synthase [Archangium sp.]